MENAILQCRLKRGVSVGTPQTSFLSRDVHRTECVEQTMFSVMTPVSNKNKIVAPLKSQLWKHYFGCFSTSRRVWKTFQCEVQEKNVHEGCMCRWVFFEFAIISPRARGHLEHQITFSPSRCMFYVLMFQVVHFLFFFLNVLSDTLEHPHLDFFDVLIVCAGEFGTRLMF